MAIRVLQMITELRPAGAERCVYELATRLGSHGVEAEVLALRGGAMADALRDAGVPVHVLGVRGKLDVMKYFPLRRLLARGGYDVLHTHLFHADLAGRLAMRRAKIPHLVHSVHVAERRFRPWRFTWAKWMATRCDRIVCVSDGVRDDHARRTGLDREHYAVIHNGVDTDTYRGDPAARAEIRRQWGLAEDDIVAAFVGRLDPQKGLEVLQAAFDRAGEVCPKLHLVIAGDGPKRKQVERWAAQSPWADRIQVLGFTPAVPAVLAGADLFCQPSRWEGFCLAAAEAMAAGLPVAATDVAGLNEVVVPGETGLLTAEGLVRAFAASIVTLCEDADLRRQFGQAGRARAQERFSIDRYVREHAELYKSL